MPTTTNYALPYPGLSDQPHGPNQIQALAVALDPILTRMDTQPIAAVFTSNGTYTPPAGLKAVRVRVQGAGGGGGAAGGSLAAQASTGGGGGGGGFSEEIIPASALGASVAVTVGAGGTAGAAGSGVPGGTGGTSSFGAFLSASGGAGGDYGVSSAAGTTGGGLGGSGTGGTLNMDGRRGGRGRVLLGEPTGPGLGGGSVLGQGADGAPGTSAAAGIPGSGYGAGGSGGLLRASQSTVAGGAGTQGVVIVESLF